MAPLHNIHSSRCFCGRRYDQFQLGVNQFDSGQAAGSAAATFEATGAFLIDGNDWKVLAYADVKAGAPVATTTATHTGVVNKPLPPHMLFRLASALVPDPANPVSVAAPGEPWRSGGVSSPYTQNPQLQSGGFFWAMSNCTSATNEPLWLSFCLWNSVDGASNWTEDTTNAGYLKAFGSASDYSTHGTGGGASKYNLKPAFLPFGCNVSGVSHPFCILYSAIKVDTTGTILSRLGRSYQRSVYDAWLLHFNTMYRTNASDSYRIAVGICCNPIWSVFKMSEVSPGPIIFTSICKVRPFGPFTIILTSPANPATAGSGTTLAYYQLGLVPTSMAQIGNMRTEPPFISIAMFFLTIADITNIGGRLAIKTGPRHLIPSCSRSRPRSVPIRMALGIGILGRSSLLHPRCTVGQLL